MSGRPAIGATGSDVQLFKEIARKVDDFQKLVEEELDNSVRKAQRASRTIVALTAVVVAFGIFLLLASFVLLLTKGPSLEVLGVSALGTADFVTVFFFKPMERLLSATINLARYRVTLIGWTIGVKLNLAAVEQTNKQTMREIGKTIAEMTSQLAQNLSYAAVEMTPTADSSKS